MAKVAFITVQVEQTGTTGVAKKFRQQGGTLGMSIAEKPGKSRQE